VCVCVCVCDYETFHIPYLMSKRAIRLPDEGRVAALGGTYV